MRVRDAVCALVVVIGLSTAGCSSDDGAEARPYPPGDPSALIRTPSADASTSPSTAVAPMTPGQVFIPAIDVNTQIMAVGTREEADPFLAGERVTSFEVPPDLARVGWWSDGPMPGARGMSILLGHSQVGGGYAVFNRLGELKAGDRISLEDSTARIGLTYSVTDVVTGISKYDAAALQVELARHSTSSSLALITCSGDFDNSVAESEANTAVFAIRA